MQDNSQYLRFSAYSIKDLITRKLSEDTRFTDQIYEGSNLAILIDLVSYMYQCLIYQLNSSAAEAMWSDTQIYENINRLCKFIGYNPKGYSPSTVTFHLNDFDDEVRGTVFRYSAIDTGKIDNNGKKIYYSLVNDQALNVTDSDDGLNYVFYNGLWKLYQTIFTSSGAEYQTFILNNIKSDSDKKCYVSEKMIHVYIKEPNNDSLIKWECSTDGLFMDSTVDNGSYIYSNIDNVYSIRLNENKEYELSFGNNNTGRIPPQGSLIYIMYLDSNEPTIELTPFEISDKQLLHSKTLFGMSEQLYTEMFENISSNNSNIYSNTKYLWTNIEKSSTGQQEETVDEIRRNAPAWFKTGNRLITASDYEYFIRNRFKSDIIDVKCQNNAEYISTFYRWLYNIGIKQHNNGHFYITPNKIVKYDLRYADAADSNNVYIWIKMQGDAEIYKEIINNEIQGVKSLTHEPVYLAPIITYFTPCAQSEESARKMYFSDNSTMFDQNNYSYIEVTIENNTLYANSNIQQRVASEIINFFNEQTLQLGQIINNNTLIDNIYNIGAISNIRTVYYNQETGEKRILNGIAFATWSATYIDLGDDLEISTSSKSLEPFQFPKLYNSADIANKIKVIRKSINNVNTVQY